jgi:hypothetical protein
MVATAEPNINPLLSIPAIETFSSINIDMSSIAALNIFEFASNGVISLNRTPSTGQLTTSWI